MNPLQLGSVRVALAAFFVMLAGSSFAEEGWLVSFEKAKAQAAKEGKPIFMEFTGSDWCPPCKALHKNVLTSAVFKKQMPEKFILLKLDNPRDKSKQTPEEIAQYKKLSSQYKVRGVPTVIIADPKGKEQHRQVGYRSTESAKKWVSKIIAASKGGTKKVTAKDTPKKPAGGGVEVKPASDLPAKIKDLLDRYKEMRAKNPDKAGAQAIKDSGKLARENPDELRPWSLYLSAANFAKDPKEKKAIFEEVAAAKSPKLAGVVAKAKGELTKLDALGKPVDMKFTAIDGREVDLSKMKGKVVLIDFWATWCGPCVREIPNVVKSYEKLHSKGFEIVGISLERDKDPEKLLAYVEEKKMPWAQYHDGLQWKNKISTKFGIRSIPAMWLIDKKGNLVDMNARSGLETKVEKLLAQ